MSRDGNDSVPPRQNNFSLLCFWTISSRAGESYTYMSAWKTGILLTKLPSETKINAHPFATDSPCLLPLSVTGAPESPENMKTTALQGKFLFSANRAWNCANTSYASSDSPSDTRSYFLRSFDVSFTASLTSISIFRIKNNQCHITRFYIPLYFTLHVIKENWPVIFTVFL